MLLAGAGDYGRFIRELTAGACRKMRFFALYAAETAPLGGIAEFNPQPVAAHAPYVVLCACEITTILFIFCLEM